MASSAVVFVLAFYVFAAILAGRGIFQPRYGAFIVHRIPLNHTTFHPDTTYSLNDSHSNPDTFLPSSFFIAAFKIGRSRNLSLIIDTASSDVLLAPDLYRPSPHSEDLYYGDTAAASRDGNISFTTVAYEAMSDHIGIDGLAIPAQSFANVFSPNGSRAMYSDLLPGNTSGIMGLLPGQTSVSNTSSWMRRVGDEHQLPSNRYGLLLKVPSADANGVAGELHLGGLDQDSYSGTLVVTTLNEPATATISGILVADEHDLILEQNLVFASGTERIFGPRHWVQALFNATGIQGQDEGARFRGYFDCEAPPTVGFRFPYNSTDGDVSTLFNVEGKALGRNIGNGACLATIEGVDMLDDTWIIGHAFMQGKYVDFNLDDGSIGIAYLKDRYV